MPEGDNKVRILALEVGGPIARLCITEHDRRSISSGQSIKCPDRKLVKEAEIECSLHPTIISLVAEFLEGEDEISIGVFSLACFIANDQTCNLLKIPHWPQIKAVDLKAALPIKEVFLLNDFEAPCYALPYLQESDLIPLTDHKPQPGATVGLLGPRLGLGEAFMLPGNVVLATEGGHTEFPAMDDEDWEL